MAIALARILCVVLLSFILNIFRKNPITWRWQMMIIFSGLRGAFAFALAIRNVSTKARSLMYTTTSIIVIITVIFNGTLTAPVLKWLRIRYDFLSSPSSSSNDHSFRVNTNEDLEVSSSGHDRYRMMELNPNVRYLFDEWILFEETNCFVFNEYSQQDRRSSDEVALLNPNDDNDDDTTITLDVRQHTSPRKVFVLLINALPMGNQCSYFRCLLSR